MAKAKKKTCFRLILSFSPTMRIFLKHSAMLVFNRYDPLKKIIHSLFQEKNIVLAIAIRKGNLSANYLFKVNTLKHQDNVLNLLSVNNKDVNVIVPVFSLLTLNRFHSMSWHFCLLWRSICRLGKRDFLL